jgi:hypothetical protein
MEARSLIPEVDVNALRRAESTGSMHEGQVSERMSPGKKS